MQRFDYCAYPPLISPDVEISEQQEPGRRSFVAGAVSVGRYLRLGVAERQVLECLDGTFRPLDVCRELAERHGAALQIGELTPFLAKLDEVGILDGRRHGGAQRPLLPGNQLYLRCSLFNPDPLFGRLLRWLRWIWTGWFFLLSLLLFAVSTALCLLNWPQVSTYGVRTLQDHYLAVFVVAWLVTVSHEFAHGMTSKAFGGRATEIGVLLIYYCFPALYCNVSGLYLIPNRRRRMWVIAAGVYWQLLVGACALAVWFMFHPDTLPARIAMLFVLGSLLDLLFNANPLIKLDGYYFLSQYLRIPNLMERSRALWRTLFRRILLGERNPEAPRATARERRILLPFGFFSYLYNLSLPLVIVWYAARFLMDRFQLAGLALSGLLLLAYVWKPATNLLRRTGGLMTTTETEKRPWRRFAPAAAALCFAGALCLPWTASVGSYGTLVALPGREAIIRAAESASLVRLTVQPGQQVVRGTAVGWMGNLDLEDQAAQARTDLARVDADAERIGGELRVQQESAASAEWQLAQKRREFDDVDREEQQIRGRQLAAVASNFVLVSNPSTAPQPPQLPAALAAKEAEAGQLQARLTEARQELSRARKLYEERLLARSVLEVAETKESTLSFELSAARERLEAALIEHRRAHSSTGSAVNVANANVSTGRANIASLMLQLEGIRRTRQAIEQRLALLQQKTAQFELIAPLSGTLYGEEPSRITGQYFPKGTEICHLADTHELMVRVLVAEQSIGDVAVGQEVRLKTRAFPDRLFHGVVSRIGGEAETDSNGQRAYRVELTVQNRDLTLRLGMTAFARIDFGCHPLGWLVAHKLKQALRPEIWLL